MFLFYLDKIIRSFFCSFITISFSRMADIDLMVYQWNDEEYDVEFGDDLEGDTDGDEEVITNRELDEDVQRVYENRRSHRGKGGRNRRRSSRDRGRRTSCWIISRGSGMARKGV